MSMGSGPQANALLANLSLSDPRCDNDSCSAFYIAHQASQSAVSYSLQYEYGHWTTWYYLGVLGLFSLLQLSRLLRGRFNARTTSPTLVDKARAARRFVSYRHLHGPLFDRLGLPSAGMAGFLFVPLALFVVAIFAITPYYRGHRGYGSPPVAVRSGLMAVACTPVIVALSGKANIITLLTGIGHERLNVIHRYTAWMCLLLSIVHTVPFIIAPLNDGGPAALHAQFYKPGAFEYTGVPPLAVLFSIVLLSILWIRHRAYETFWHLHVLLGLMYIGLMFWHAGNEQDSWAYLWATLAILFSSVLARIFVFNRATNVHSAWFHGSLAKLTCMPGGMTRISLVAPFGFAWQPGQHCYLRVPSVRPWDNHPFTIATAPLPRSLEKVRGQQELLFLARTRAGFTRDLHRLVCPNPEASAEVWLDGPYGGIRHGIEQRFHSFVLVAGGAGISACLPWLQTLARSENVEAAASARNVTLFWIVRRSDHVAWVRPELQTVMAPASTGCVNLHIYVTREAHGGREVEEKGCDVGDEGDSRASDSSTRYYRPLLGDLLRECRMEGKTMVIVSGPESLKIDASNACAEEQRRVLEGSSREIKFHSETFGW